MELTDFIEIYEQTVRSTKDVPVQLITENHFCNQAIIEQPIKIDPPLIVSQPSQLLSPLLTSHDEQPATVIVHNGQFPL